MTTALLADAHLGGPGGPAGPLVAQLEAILGRATRLVVLGDLFQVWVGDRRFETADHQAVLAALARLRAAGIEVIYIEGNRDFFLAESVYAASFDRVAVEHAFVAGGRRCLAVHGDGLNERDWQYRVWRWLSKSAPSRLAWRLLPTRLASRLTHRTERALSATNFRHKQRIPEEAVRRYGERRLAEGHDLLLLGHFHEPRRWAVGAGEVRIVEAWFTSRQLEWLD